MFKTRGLLKGDDWEKTWLSSTTRKSINYEKVKLDREGWRRKRERKKKEKKERKKEWEEERKKERKI